MAFSYNGIRHACDTRKALDTRQSVCRQEYQILNNSSKAHSKAGILLLLFF